jgi:hypothetical protein
MRQNMAGQAEFFAKNRIFGHKKTPREKEVRKPGGLPDNTEPEKQRLYKLIDDLYAELTKNTSKPHYQSKYNIRFFDSRVKSCL